VYEFSSATPDFESRDDDVIDCCPRHYQMALVDATTRAPPSLETFRPGTEATPTAAAPGVGECCPLMSAQQRYGAAAAVVRLHDRRRSSPYFVLSPSTGPEFGSYSLFPLPFQGRENYFYW